MLYGIKGWSEKPMLSPEQTILQDRAASAFREKHYEKRLAWEELNPIWWEPEKIKRTDRLVEVLLAASTERALRLLNVREDDSCACCASPWQRLVRLCGGN